VGGGTLEAIAAICGEDGNLEQVQRGTPHAEGRVRQVSSVVDKVALLLDQNLLRQVEGGESEPRLMMLETIRQYALDCLAASGEAHALRQRHAQYYLALAETADAMLRGPEQGLWLAQLEAEHDNLRAALEWYQATDPERGLRLAVALWQFWEMRSHLSEGRACLQELLRVTRDAPTLLRAQALHGMGVLTYHLAEYQQAKEPLIEALVLFQQLDDEYNAAPVLRTLGLVAWFQGDHELARTQLEESVALYRRLEHSWGIADALHYLGHVLRDLGDVETARTVFEERMYHWHNTAGGQMCWSSGAAVVHRPHTQVLY
jgi:tetratricopeptide (TPR) repeat protein